MFILPRDPQLTTATLRLRPLRSDIMLGNQMLGNQLGQPLRVGSR